MIFRIRRWFSKAAAIGVGALAGLLACEVIFRIQEPFFHIVEGRDPSDLYLYTRHPIWNHWVLPHTLARVQMPSPGLYAKPYTYATNDFGCRYPKDLAVPKPNDIRRILVLGDSFAEGFYYEDTVGFHLETRLNQSISGSHFEVVNCACASYSPLLEYLRLKNQLIEMQPDEIILIIDQTDVFDDYWRYRPLSRFASDGEPLSAGESFTPKEQVIEWAKRRTYLVRVLSRVRWLVAARFQSSDAYRPPPVFKNLFMYHSSLPIQSEAWQREVGFCLANILRIIHFTRQRGIPLMVTMYPHRQNLKADLGEKLWHREFEHRVEQLCRKNGVHFFSAFDGIANAYRTDRSVYLDGNMHFSPAGQRIWADLVTGDYFAWSSLAR